MKLKQLFESKKCVFSLEVFPPKKNGGNPTTLYPALDEMKQLNPDYISVTYGAAGGPAGMSTVQIASHIKKTLGIEPLAHLTCINSEPEDVEKVLHTLKEQGVENILALRGDRCPDAHPARSYQHASDLMRVIAETGDFYMAGACYPEGHTESDGLMQDIENLRYKVEAGAGHLVTQLFFDNTRYFRFINLLRKKGIALPVQAGVMPITTKRQIERTVSLTSASLPAEFTKMLARYSDNEQAMFDAGIDYAIRQIRDLVESGADGIHLYAMNQPRVAKRVYEGIRDLLTEET